MSGPRLTEPHHGPGYEPERSLGPPWHDFEDAVEYFKRSSGVADPTAMAGYVKGGGRAPNVARTRSPPVHPNARSTFKWEGPEDDRVRDKVREAVEDAAEEAFERSKNLLKR